MFPFGLDKMGRYSYIATDRFQSSFFVILKMCIILFLHAPHSQIDGITEQKT